MVIFFPNCRHMKKNLKNYKIMDVQYKKHFLINHLQVKLLNVAPSPMN